MGAVALWREFHWWAIPIYITAAYTGEFVAEFTRKMIAKKWK